MAQQRIQWLFFIAIFTNFSAYSFAYSTSHIALNFSAPSVVNSETMKANLSHEPKQADSVQSSATPVTPSTNESNFAPPTTNTNINPPPTVSDAPTETKTEPYTETNPNPDSPPSTATLPPTNVSPPSSSTPPAQSEPRKNNWNIQY